MTKTRCPVITITVAGPEDAGKNRVLAIIEDALKYHLGRDIIIDSPALHNKREKHTDWSKPPFGTIFELEEVNLFADRENRTLRNMSYTEALAFFRGMEFSDPVGHSLTKCDDFLALLDLALNHQNKLTAEIAVEEYLKFTLAPLLTECPDKEKLTDEIAKISKVAADLIKARQQNETERKEIRDKAKKEYNQLTDNTVRAEHCGECTKENDSRMRIIKLVDQQLNGSIDSVTARAIWYNVTKTDDITCLADYLSFAFNCAVNRSHHTIMERGIKTHGIPESSPEQEMQAENISRIYTSIILQLYGRTDITRAYKFWLKTLEEMRDNKSLLVEILIQVIADINNQQDTAE